MHIGNLYYISKPQPNIPREDRYLAEVNRDIKKSFIHEEDALLFLFDNGIRYFQRFTKDILEYKNTKNIPTYELCHLNNRVGYISHGNQPYTDETGKVQKRKAFIWRFIGYGRSCFAPTREELKEKVASLIQQYKEDREGKGFNIYPFYTRHCR
ncbi:hypothetical protein ACJMCD_28585 (plasmid) [Priestia megaterium]|uniref:hypothetical protein n=1 Tax=Priestia megaterium TaxID=1404 RepID=UPI003899FE3B